MRVHRMDAGAGARTASCRSMRRGHYFTTQTLPPLRLPAEASPCGHSSSPASGSRNGRRPPGISGNWKEYRPSMLMWWRTAVEDLPGERVTALLEVGVHL